jgi:hypothetical protein
MPIGGDASAGLIEAKEGKWMEFSFTYREIYGKSEIEIF